MCKTSRRTVSQSPNTSKHTSRSIYCQEENLVKSSKNASILSTNASKHSETPVYQIHNSFSLLEIAAFAALIIGVFQFAQNGDPKLFMFGCILAAVKEGPSTVKSVLLLIREKFPLDDSKKSRDA